MDARRARGPQQFAKVGTRNAMVIAVCSFALTLSDGRVGTCIGSRGADAACARRRPRRSRRTPPWSGGALGGDVAARFGALVAEAASPIDDVRGTAAYRRTR